MIEEFVGVSACLVGENCRYDGRNSLNKKVVNFISKKNLIIFCPEILGGLPVLREPAEIKYGNGKDVLNKKCRVINKKGEDVTEYYVKGAEITFRILKMYNVNFVILKQLSPACGKGKIYDGSFSKKIIEGNGVTAQFLLDNRIGVITEEEL
ncbi:MAG TPA: DUF523 domain-containing protein [Candidatus Ratteibacteria bacterium]|nr:DUF523 domain-containing protein [bacterium]HRR95476.1 DUF523 domain-containing protein [Candidatus Ratteibacteria bacterium]